MLTYDALYSCMMTADRGELAWRVSELNAAAAVEATIAFCCILLNFESVYTLCPPAVVAPRKTRGWGVGRSARVPSLVGWLIEITLVDSPIREVYYFG